MAVYMCVSVCVVYVCATLLNAGDSQLGEQHKLATNKYNIIQN